MRSNRIAALLQRHGSQLRDEPRAHVPARVGARHVVFARERLGGGGARHRQFPRQRSLELSGAAVSVAAGPRIAVVHEWLLDFAGSERVLREILEIVPQADLFALVDQPDEELMTAIPRRAKATSFLQRLPRPRRWLRYYVPLMPLAVEQLDVSAYDIVVSSSHAVAKGVITGPRQLHLSYVHTPMRYAWDLQHEYLRAAGLERGPAGWAARLVLHRLRQWDVRSANGVDVFLANSAHVARRISKAYRRGSEERRVGKECRSRWSPY